MNLGLSVDKRILLHISRYSNFKDSWEVPFALSQEGISETLDMLLNNVSRAITSLKNEGLVWERLAHVEGTKRRRKACFLTEKGVGVVESITKELLQKKFQYIDRSRITKEGSLDAVLGQFKAEYGLSADLIDVMDFLQGKTAVNLSELAVYMNSRAIGVGGKKLVRNIQEAPQLRRFVGRDKELGEIKEALDSQEVRVVVIEGIAGIGKSTLGAKLLDENRFSKNLFWYRVHEWDTVRNIMFTLSRFLTMFGRRRLETYLKGRQIDLNEVEEILHDELQNSDALLFFDDFHNATEQIVTFFSLLLEVLERVQGAKVVVLTRESKPFYDERERLLKGSVKVFTLCGLDEKSAKALLGDEIEEERFASIFASSKGHPLFLELLSISKDATDRRDMDSFITEEVYSKLTVEEKKVLEILSVYRLPVKKEAVLMEGARYDDFLSLVRKNLVQEEVGGAVEEHEIIKDFIYPRISKESMDNYHREAAEYYLGDAAVGEEFGLSEIEAVYHMKCAGEWEKAAALATQILPGLMAQSFDVSDTISDFKAYTLSENSWAEILTLKGDMFALREEWLAAIESYEEALEIKERIGSPPSIIAVLHNNIGNMQKQIMQWEETIKSHEKALDIFRRIGDPVGEAKEYLNLGLIYKSRKEWEKSSENYEKSLRILQKNNDKRGMAAVYNNFALLKDAQRDWKGAVEYLQKSIALARQSGDFMGEGIASLNMGELYLKSNENERADSHFQKSLELFKDCGEWKKCQEVALSIGDLYREKGDRQHAFRYYGSGVEFENMQKRKGKGGNHPVSVSGARLWSRIADHHRCAGEWRKCLEARRRAIECWSGLKHRSMVGKEYLEMALDYEEMGGFDNAIESLHRSLAVLSKSGEKKGLIAVNLNLARIHEKKGAIEQAIKTLEPCVEIASSIGDMYGTAKCLEKLGFLYLSKNDMKGEKMLAKATELYKKLGMKEEEKKLRFSMQHFVQ